MEIITKETLSDSAVRCSDVSYHYPDGARALDEINLSIPKGQKLGIIGANGAGKSTLLMALNGVLQAEGTIHIFDLALIKQNFKKIKARFGLVFQNPDDQLFSPTILDDVMFAPLNLGFDQNEALAMARKALKTVDLEDKQERSVLHLSFGERKRAAIATVLAMQPSILALDEPTSNLDPRRRRNMIRWIQNQACTFIITSHDLDMIYETCERVVILSQGCLVADGSTESILHDQALLESHQLELPLCRQWIRADGTI